MGDQELGDMLRRATAPPDSQLVDSMVRVSEQEWDADDRVDGAAVDGSRSRRRRRRRQIVWSTAVAAVAAAVVLAVVAVDRDGASDLHTGPADVDTTGDPALDAPHVLPTVWPEGVDGPIETAEVVDLASDSYQAPAVLIARDGKVVATSLLASYGLPETGSSPPAGGGVSEAFDTTLADGRRAQGLHMDGHVSLFVELGSERSAMLRSPVLDRGELELLATAVEPGGGVDPTLLPAGWAIVDDPTGGIALAAGVMPDTSTPWRFASRSTVDPARSPRNVAIITAPLIGSGVTPDEVLDDIRRVLDTTPIAVGDRDGVLLPHTQSVRALALAADADTLAIVTGEGITDEELSATAASLHEVSDDEWESRRMPRPPASTAQPLCEALRAHPDGLATVVGSNGFTQTEGSWSVVFSARLFDLDPASRASVASAVAADDEGFDRLRAVVETSARPALDRLRAIAVDPNLTTHPADPTVDADLAVLRDLSLSCGLA